MLDLSTLSSYFLLGLIGWFTYKVYIWPYYISPLRKVPGLPSSNPFFGSIERIINEEAGELHVKCAEKYGPIFRFHELLNRPAIVIADAKLLQDLLISNPYDYTKPFMDSVTKLFGFGLISAEGDSHKRQRKMMTPAFTYNNIKNMVQSYIRVASTLKGIIENEIGTGESGVNLTPILSRATLDIIGLVGFSYEFNSLTSTNELAEAYEIAMDPSSSRGMLDMAANYFPILRKIPLEENKKYDHACEVISRVSKKLVDDKYREAENDKLDKRDLLSLLININKTLPIEEKMTDDELRYQVMTFLLAGHETSNVLICWALYELATHPDEQDLLREELIKAFPDKSNFNPTYDEINALDYLNCITKETLRLNSPVPASLRTTAKDKVIGDYLIPKDTLILISIASLHKLPSIWGPTAKDFDPKRWLNPKDEFKTNFMPFLNGSRSCIGNKIAISEFKIILSMLILNFVFRPVDGLHIYKKYGKLGPKPHPRLELNVSRV